MLALIDVLHCGYCGRKMTNGSKYNYWTIKDTGERRTIKLPFTNARMHGMGFPMRKRSSIVQTRLNLWCLRHLQNISESFRKMRMFSPRLR